MYMLISLLPKEKEVFKIIVESGFEYLKKTEYEDLKANLKRLEELGFIVVAREEGGDVIDVRTTPKGKSYISQNPQLQNPVDENEIKILQLKELEYKDKIRGMERIILTWKLISAICGILAFALAVFLAISK